MKIQYTEEEAEKAGKILASLRGKKTFQKHGREHYIEIQKKAAAKRKENRLKRLQEAEQA